MTDGGSVEENVLKTISYVSSAVFLIAAITMFFVTYADSDDAIELVNRKLTDKGTVYQANTADYNDALVTGAFIIGIIKNCPGYDIYIDSDYIPAGTDAVMFDFSFINVADYYTVEYIYEPDGKIECIWFSKK
jgi:hypothetical protein